MKVGVIVAMESEYEALRAVGIENVVRSGIGKVNAARVTTELIINERPDYIISSGVAGGIDDSLNIGDFVIANQVAYHDVCQVQGLPQRFCADSGLLTCARTLKVPDVSLHEGLICTGDQFLTTLEEDREVKRIYPDALACDMESAAVAQVCLHYAVPFNHQQAYDNFWQDLKANSFSLIKRLLDNLQ